MATTINFDSSKEKYNECVGEIREKSFNNGLKILKKKHDKRTLNDIYEVINLIKTFELTTQKDNHIVGNDYECHIGGHNSDILLIWNYKIENEKCYVHLKDIVNYQQLKSSLLEARQQTALKSNGVYSVLKDEWIKEPVAEDIPEIDKEAFDIEFKKWEDRYLNIVNNNTNLDTIEESAKIKRLYEYDGPIYVFNKLIKPDTHIETRAVSLKQAINNIIFNAASEIGYNRAYGANIHIREDDVHLVDSDFVDDEEDFDGYAFTREKCPKCGLAYLTDSGECPICDLGDWSCLDEDLTSDEEYKVEEIEDFIEDIYDLRKTSIAKDGEYSIGNLVFKELRSKGCLDNLRELKRDLMSKKYSIK